MTMRVKAKFWTLTLSVLFSLLALNAVGDFVKQTTIAKVAKIYGEDARRRASALNSLMTSLQDATEQEKLIKVNDFFNSFRWVDDMQLWHKKDYWATRMEFVGKGAGDCEDYVIAKYFTLKQLGIPTQKLYFTYVKALRYNQAHMVLAYYDTKQNPKWMELIDRIGKEDL